MLVIKYKNGDTGWRHVGPHMKHAFNSDIAANVVYVQADGDELDCIVRQVENLPYNKTKRIQTWFGDMAQFLLCSVDFSK